MARPWAPLANSFDPGGIRPAWALLGWFEARWLFLAPGCFSSVDGRHLQDGAAGLRSPWLWDRRVFCQRPSRFPLPTRVLSHQSLCSVRMDPCARLVFLPSRARWGSGQSQGKPRVTSLESKAAGSLECVTALPPCRPRLWGGGGCSLGRETTRAQVGLGSSSLELFLFF